MLQEGQDPDAAAGAGRVEEAHAQRGREPPAAPGLDRHAGAGPRHRGKFNLVPYGGGNPTSVAVLNGEGDIGALPIAGVVAHGDQLQACWASSTTTHKMAKYTDNAPSVNKVAGTKIPALPRRAPGPIHTEFIEKYPQKFALLEKTSRQVFDNPKYKEEYAKTGAPVETIQYGDRELCTEYANHMVELANEYRTLLTAKG